MSIELKKVEAEVAKFMRGKYCFDEVAGMNSDIPCLKFLQDEEVIVQ